MMQFCPKNTIYFVLAYLLRQQRQSPAKLRPAISGLIVIYFLMTN